MKKTKYVHTGIEGIASTFSSDNPVLVRGYANVNSLESIRLAAGAMRLALRLGIRRPQPCGPQRLPYADDNDDLVFDAPLLSFAVGRRMRYLRGWKQYDSCVKGFNGLGLLAEHALKEQRRLEAGGLAALQAARREFLRSRKRADPADGSMVPVFAPDEVNALTDRDLDAVAPFDLALWRAYGSRPVVCSTSSNMGISLHQALRHMQQATLEVCGRRVTVLNPDEGWLVIWCPDERADFMNPEKTEVLRSLETEQPPLTVLHTYINRKERDPGALRDALNDGGYFFPTNPQSEEEMQNLFFIALNDIAGERKTTIDEVLKDPKVRRTLESLDCLIEDNRVIVQAGVVGGLYGLMLPYLLMLESVLPQAPAAISAWNQASIGAALAALVLADVRLSEFNSFPDDLQRELAELFPNLVAHLRKHKWGRPATRIHGVFDIANLQSLAQLLGVVVERHLSGRKTALVGLGSSSYATGNRCYDVLKESMEKEGPFRGRTTFHPMTHALIPVAQAMTYADDLFRVVRSEGFAKLAPAEQAERVMRHAVKTEPAGAAAVAGYLLSRLDTGTLSLVEIAYVLRTVGFTRDLFLEFAGFGRDAGAANRFLQEAQEEGDYMGSLGQNLLNLLEWEPAALEPKAALERIHSRMNYRLRPIDDEGFDALDPVTHLDLTGDNTRQPPRHMVDSLIQCCLRNRAVLERALGEEELERARHRRLDLVTVVNRALSGIAHSLHLTERRLDGFRRNVVRSIIARTAKQAESLAAKRKD